MRRRFSRSPYRHRVHVTVTEVVHRTSKCPGHDSPESQPDFLPARLWPIAQSAPGESPHPRLSAPHSSSPALPLPSAYQSCRASKEHLQPEQQLDLALLSFGDAFDTVGVHPRKISGKATDKALLLEHMLARTRVRQRRQIALVT